MAAINKELGHAVKGQIFEAGNIQVDHKQTKSQLEASMHEKIPFYKKGWFVGPALILIWAVTGTLFYTLFWGWNVGASFFYAVEGGFAVGFGGPMYEYSHWSKLFTIFYILAGSSFVGVGMALLFGMIDGKKDAIVKSKAEQMREEALMQDDADGDGKVSCAESVNGCCRRFKYRLEIAFSSYLIFFLFFVWFIVGILYGLLWEGWSTVDSIYFSITGLSTAGLQAPSYIDGDGDGNIDQVSMSVGFFCRALASEWRPHLRHYFGERCGVDDVQEHRESSGAEAEQAATAV